MLTYICYKSQPNACKYAIYGWLGYVFLLRVMSWLNS